jgi:hypothetical protein
MKALFHENAKMQVKIMTPGNIVIPILLIQIGTLQDRQQRIESKIDIILQAIAPSQSQTSQSEKNGKVTWLPSSLPILLSFSITYLGPKAGEILRWIFVACV